MTERYAWRHYYWCGREGGGPGGAEQAVCTARRLADGCLALHVPGAQSAARPAVCAVAQLNAPAPPPTPTQRRFLTDSGIEFLREFLNLPSEIVPATLKKSTRPLERDSRPPRRDGPPRRFGGDREGYRGAEGKAGAPGEYRPEVRGGGGGPGG